MFYVMIETPHSERRELKICEMDELETAKNHICEACCKNFSSAKSLSRHRLSVHGVSVRRQKQIAKGGIVCEICSKRFVSSKSLSEHRIKIHKISIRQLKRTAKMKETTQRTLPQNRSSIKCNTCTATFRRREDYRLHLRDVHNVEDCCNVVEKRFISYEEFMEWKTLEEGIQRVKFVSCLKRRNKHYFYCHRSGHDTSLEHSSRKRQPKSTGFMKSGHCCPASIILDLSGEIKMEYYSTHYGHCRSVAYLHLSASLKQEIAGKLFEGATVRQIVRDVRSNNGENVARDLLVTKKDVHNIRKLFRIPHVPPDVSDSNSTMKYIKNCTLLYKDFGQRFKGLLDDELVIVIMSCLQKEILKKFAHNGVCIDTCDTTLTYEVQLTTLFLVDEFEEGVPLAFCISSNVNVDVMKCFFKTVKDAVGLISADVFMSDNDLPYHDIWLSIMGSCNTELACSWHVMRAWKKMIRMIDDKVTRRNVYKCLSACLYERDENNFGTMLNRFYDEFVRFEGLCVQFFNTYDETKEKWAYVFRPNAKVESQSHVNNIRNELNEWWRNSECKQVYGLLRYLAEYLHDSFFSKFAKIIMSS